MIFYNLKKILISFSINLQGINTPCKLSLMTGVPKYRF